MITQARLKELLRYDPETGEFYWRVNRGRGGYKPALTIKRAGGVNSSDGYWYIRVDDKLYSAHRLAWLWIYGKFPSKELDHKNRKKLDNRIVNLRESNRIQNSANSSMHKDNGSGLKGVTKKVGGWVAQIGKNYNVIYLGYFKTPEAAHAAYCKAAKKLHGKFFSSGA